MSRDLILQKIRANKMEVIDLPRFELHRFKIQLDVKESFISSVESVGGKVISVKDRVEISRVVQSLYPDAKEIISLAEGINISTINSNEVFSKKKLDKLELAVIEGQFGVSENGAVWVSDKNFFHRSIPFIVLHLVIVLKLENIVENMHEACAQISGFTEGYGVFISGPSKTADIEQSLVIGAQGPLSLTIFLIEEDQGKE